MSSCDHEWEKALRMSPFSKPRFTPDLKTDVLKRIEGIQPRKQRIVLMLSVPVILLLVAVVGLSFLLDSSDNTWKVRAGYSQAGHPLFRIFPDPALAAGRPDGYMVSFTESFDHFAGKQLAIYAIHKQSGLRVTALPPTTITTPSPGYSSLQRFTASFGLPISGIWRYVVELDGRFYGDAVLRVAEPSWELTPQFQTETYRLRGIPNRVGFLDAGFIAGKTNKYMWHFWGTEEELNGPFRVMAVKQGTDSIIPIFSSVQLGGPLNGADRMAVSSMSLPEPGRWRLLVYVNDRLFDSIVVQVRK